MTFISTIALLIIMFVSFFVIAQFIDIEKHIGLAFLIGFVVEAIIIGGGIYLITIYIPRKFLPAHLEFVQMLMRFKENEIVAGTFNGELMINTKVSNNWETQNFGCWIDSDYHLKLKEGFDYYHPVHITVDLTTEITKVYVENKEIEGGVVNE